MKVREVLAMLRKGGWYLVQQKGSHRQLKHATKPGRVTVAGNLGDDVLIGTLSNILRQVELKSEEKS